MKIRRTRRMHWVNVYSTHHGCAECKALGIDFPWPSTALQFDHNDPADKLFSIKSVGSPNYPADLKGRENVKRLVAEIRKCTVRCANHHAIKTKEENQARPKWLDKEDK